MDSQYPNYTKKIGFNISYSDMQIQISFRFGIAISIYHFRLENSPTKYEFYNLNKNSQNQI